MLLEHDVAKPNAIQHNIMPTGLRIVMPSHLDPEPQADTKMHQAPEARQKFTIFLQRLASHGGVATALLY